MSMTPEPPREGKCSRCKQTRPLFTYKPKHDCVRDIGLIRLDEASEHIGWMEEHGDRWCLTRVERWPSRLPELCVRCHDVEAEAEEKFIREELND